MSGQWTPAEDEALRAMYAEGALYEACTRIPSRTAPAIAQRATVLGVRLSEEHRAAAAKRGGEFVRAQRAGQVTTRTTRPADPLNAAFGSWIKAARG